MPGYPWLAQQPVKSDDIGDRMRALRTLGVPYTDAQIAAAAQVLQGKTEEDAVVAYLQGLGTGVRKAAQAATKPVQGVK
jgi:cytochrome c oxidase cbb3-type subunit 2